MNVFYVRYQQGEAERGLIVKAESVGEVEEKIAKILNIVFFSIKSIEQLPDTTILS